MYDYENLSFVICKRIYTLLAMQQHCMLNGLSLAVT